VAGRAIHYRDPAAEAADQAAVPRWPGVQAAGDILLPNQWSLRPTGKQIKLGDFPVQIVLHPRDPWAAVLHSGYGEHEIVIVDLNSDKVVSRASLDQSFYGLTFNPAGDRLYASGAEYEVVHAFNFQDGYLSGHKTLEVAKPDETFIPTGVTCSGDGKTLYVANSWGDTLCILPIAEPAKRQHVKLGDESYPYASLVSADGQRLFVSLWGKAAVSVLDLKTAKVVANWPTAAHPTELVLDPNGERLFVACANSNDVSVLDTTTGKGQETIATALYPRAANGSTPNSVCLTPDGKVLFVANADNNNLAVFDVSEPKHSRSLGYIPVGWYPTSVRYSPAKERILVANGKGLMSQANPQGPRPTAGPPETIEQYIGGLYRGTLSLIENPSPAEMASLTKAAYQASPLKADSVSVSAPPTPDHPIPARVGGPSPIKHCLYIIKENRTYDQVLGDMPEGNGDPELCLFPEHVTPNHHALAREFVLLDNFYVESEVSADGHEWSMAAYATDFVEKTWPLLYRGGKGKITYPSEGEAKGTIGFPAGGYIWDRCREAGVSYRSYGEFVINGATPDDPARTSIVTLEGHFDPQFRSYDLDYLDAKRTDRFLVELAEFEKNGNLPQFIVLRLPNDHTHGQSAGKPTPTAMVAENDLALGRLIEGVSNSKFWKETAIFIVEDDAQNGSDHVDAHRTIAFAISPYVRRHNVDSTMYSTSSMLRTMELILGLQPMSQFDAAAQPMYASFQAEPDLTPYQHLPANVDTKATNPGGTASARLSASMDFSREDAADDLLLNEVIWKSVHGEEALMPPPVRASFVFQVGEEEEEEE